jgi:hypothetical protein
MSLKYEKPLIVPFNSVADETGMGLCNPGTTNPAGQCSLGSSAPGGNCRDGTTAGAKCQAGGTGA